LVSGFDWKTAALTPEEGFVLSRIDGNTPIEQLVVLTQLSKTALLAVLEKLEAMGSIVVGTETSATDADADEFLEQCRRADSQWLLGRLREGNLTQAQARAVAAHHPTSVGLDALCNHVSFLHDEVFLNHLLKNANLSEGAFRKAVGHKPLPVLHRLSTSKEIGEKSRRFAVSALRQRFTRSEGEEQAGLVIQSEGRVLALLIGAPLSAKGAAALCGRPIGSSLLIQNFARWPSTPPNVLAHLMRQPVLRSHPELKRILQRHPNAPSDKRSTQD
jgi:hypothetical protein